MVWAKHIWKVEIRRQSGASSAKNATRKNTTLISLRLRSGSVRHALPGALFHLTLSPSPCASRCEHRAHGTEKLLWLIFVFASNFIVWQNRTKKKNNILFTVSRYLHKLWDQLGITYIMNEFFLFVFHLTGGNEQKKKSGRFDWTPDTATAIRQYGVECGAVRIGINTLPCIVLYRRIVGFTFQSELFIFPFSVFIQNKRKYGICFGEVCPLKSTLS